MGRVPRCDKNGLKKGPWTAEEDQKLIEYIQIHGYGNWRTLPKNAGLQRCGKSCRLRWTNYLRPDIKWGRFSTEEEEVIIHLHSILGNKWSAIAARLPGRTDNEIKNYWNTHIRKRLLRMGIDPVTHSPRLDLLDLSTILSAKFYNRPIGFQNQQEGCSVHPELIRLANSMLVSSQQDQTEATCYVQNVTQAFSGAQLQVDQQHHDEQFFNVFGDFWQNSQVGLVADQDIRLIASDYNYAANEFYSGLSQQVLVEPQNHGSISDFSASTSASNSSSPASRLDHFPSFNSRSSNTMISQDENYSINEHEAFEMPDDLDESMYSYLASYQNSHFNL